MIQFKKLMNGRALYQEPDKIWVAKDRRFFAVDYNGKRKSRIFTVSGGLKERLMTCWPYSDPRYAQRYSHPVTAEKWQHIDRRKEKGIHLLTFG